MRFLLSILIAIASVASADTVSDFAANAKALPHALINKGYSRIGNLELGAFVSRVERMNLRESASVSHKQDLGGMIEMERSLAEWKRTPTGDISVSSRWAKTSSEVRPLVALHESLGALGYSDDNLSCSGALYILANEEARTLLGDELKRIERIAHAECKVAGGTTGVTGGGDDYIAKGRIKGLRAGLNAIRAGQHPSKAAEDISASLYVGFERNNSFKRKGSIFDPNYKNTKQCFDPARGIADEDTIKVTFNGNPIPKNERNGWTFDEATNCIYFHGSAQHGWAGYAVLYSRKR